MSLILDNVFPSSIRNFDITHDNKFIAAVTDQKNIHISSTEKNMMIHTIETKHNPYCVTWHPKYYFLAYSTLRSRDSHEPSIRFAGTMKKNEN
ncbi:MAG: hypothetical protein MHMPM18_002508 [Marteilia pararefringens]